MALCMLLNHFSWDKARYTQVHTHSTSEHILPRLTQDLITGCRMLALGLLLATPACFLPCSGLRGSLAHVLWVWPARSEFILGGSKITADGDCSHEIKRCLLLGKESYDQPRQHIKKQRHYFANKGPFSQGYGFSSSHVWM